jgi:hypothetical protein
MMSDTLILWYGICSAVNYDIHTHSTYSHYANITRVELMKLWSIHQR